MTDGDIRLSLPDDCEPALSDVDAGRVAEQHVGDTVDVFAALANETRYRILLFVAAADGPVCGCELELYLDVGQSTISQSLSRLHRVGLLSRTKDGRWRYYDTTARADRLLETFTAADERPAPEQ